MKILFICTGNACRSALAEVILRKMLCDNDIRGVEVASCGTKFYGELDRDETMCRIAAEHGYEMGGKAIPMTEQLLNSADRIIVMTEHHHNEVTRLLTYSHWNRIVRFNDYCFGESSDLPDPHYQTEHVYRTCFDTIEHGCLEIIKNMNQNKKSIKLAYLLRHDKNYAFDEHGWREVEDLILNYGFTMPLLENIVATNNKQRYEFNDDKTRIRARQGHSIHVDVELNEATPPNLLYHGTSENVVPVILNEGLKPGTRLHVHLSSDIETALKVGRRHGNSKVLKIDSKTMRTDGVRFYLSNNGVWLTDFVPPKYISLIDS